MPIMDSRDGKQSQKLAGIRHFNGKKRDQTVNSKEIF
jgi:hypothetical protein